MRCASVSDVLKAYADGELTPLRRLTVRRHLARCASCHQEVNAMQQFRRDLRARDASGDALGDALRSRILTQTTSASSPILSRHRPIRTTRLLEYSFAVSLAVNAVFVALLGHADLFGPLRTAEEPHHAPIHVYQPPVVKVWPRPHVVPPRPVSRPKRVMTPPVFHRIPPSAPARAVSYPVVRPRPSVATHVASASHAAWSVGEGAATASAPLAARSGAVQDPVANADAEVLMDVAPKPIEAPALEPTAPPPPAPGRPKAYIRIESRAASIVSVPDPDTSGLDLSSLDGPCVVSFEVDTDGRVSDAHVSRSSGSRDFDRACLGAIALAHAVSAVQDHIPYRQPAEYAFSAQ